MEYMKFFLRFKMNKLVEEHGHTVLHTPPNQCHFSHTEMVWSQTKRCYNSSIEQNGFGMEAVKNVWEELL